jgi:dynein heavy chain 2
MSMVEVLELVELTQDALDDVWKQTEFEPLYPDNRMKHLMDIIGMYYRLIQLSVE